MTTNFGRVAVFNPSVGITDRSQVGDATDFINPYEESSSQEFPLGTKLEIGDRVFRYVLNGASGISAGKVVMMPVIESNGDVTDMAVDTMAANSTSLTGVTNGGNTAITADEYADGWAHVNSGTAIGTCLQIKSHPAVATSGSAEFKLYDRVPLAFAAASTVCLTHSKYYKVIVVATGSLGAVPTNQMIGATIVALTANYYGWVLTKGPGALISEGTTVQGGPVRPSEGTAGSVTPHDLDEGNANIRIIGTAVHRVTSADAELIDVSFE